MTDANIFQQCCQDAAIGARACLPEWYCTTEEIDKVNGISQSNTVQPSTRTRHTSDSTDTDSSTSSAGIEHRDIALIHHDDDTPLAQDLSKHIGRPAKRTIYYSSFMPGGEHRFKGLVAIGRSVKLIAFIVTKRFVRRQNYKQYECLLQSKICHFYNTILLIDEKNHRALPLYWNHYRHYEVNMETIEADLIKRIFKRHEDLFTGTFAYSFPEHHPIVGNENPEKLVVVSNVSEISRYARSGQSGAKISQDKDRQSLIKAILDMAKWLPTNIPFKFVGDDINILPREESNTFCCGDISVPPQEKFGVASFLSQLWPPPSWTDALQRYVLRNIHSNREGGQYSTRVHRQVEPPHGVDTDCIHSQSDETEREQIFTLTYSDGPVAEESNTDSARPIHLSSASRAFNQSDERIPIPHVNRKGHPRIKGARSGGRKNSNKPPLQAIRETTRVRHYLVKNLPRTYTSESVKRCLTTIFSESQKGRVIRVARFCNADSRSKCFKIALCEDLMTLRKIDFWPTGAKIVRFYFPAYRRES